MQRNYKYLIISFLVCLPFWWGMNILASNLEDFLFLQNLAKNPNILNASLNDGLNQLRLKEINTKRAISERLNNANLSASSIVVIDIDLEGNSQIVFEKNVNKIRPIASLSKLMTALVVLDLDETYNLSQEITITKNAVEQEGSSEFEKLKIGDRFSAGVLLHKMLIESSNDAAFALANVVGEKAFVDLMNFQARKIGLADTYFTNSTGLDSDNPRALKNASTVQDLAKLAQYIIENYPQIFQITADRRFMAENTNKLLPDYPEIIGGKTGWTTSAGGCLLVVTQKPDKKGYYINIVLGAPGVDSRFDQMRQILNASR